MNTRKLGVQGEQSACEYLEKLGYGILDRNVLYHGGEIDIVALDGQTVVFVEVKTRDSNKFGNPLEAITPTKVKAIVKCAQLFLLKNRWINRDSRFDVITIVRDKIEHIKDAFWAN